MLILQSLLPCFAAYRFKHLMTFEVNLISLSLSLKICEPAIYFVMKKE